MQTTTARPADRQPHRPRRDAHGRQDARRRGAPHARPLRRRGRHARRHRGHLRRRASPSASLAPWLARRRDDVVLATKVRFETDDPAGAGLSPDRIRAACDASLRAPGHRRHRPLPGPRARSGRPARGDARGARRPRARGQGARGRRLELPGVAARVGGRAAGPQRLGAVRRRCSRSTRSSSARSRSRCCRSAAPPGSACCRGGRSAPGFLTGRYRRDAAMPEGSRMATAADDLEEAPARRAIERNFRVVDAAEAIAAERGATVAQVAIAWLLGRRGRGRADRRPAHDGAARGPARRRRARPRPPTSAPGLEAPAPPPDLYPQRMLTEQVGLDVVTGPLRRG